MRRWRIVALVSITFLILGAAYFLFHANYDVVVITNGSGNENGILVSAQGSSGALSDKPFTSTTNTINVGQLTAAASRNEVIAFTNSRPVALTPATWMPGSDTMDLQFADEIKISITVWILKGPFADQSQAAKNRCIDVAAMWRSERMGIAFAEGGCDIRDATSNTEISQFMTFKCDNDKLNDLQQAIGRTPNRINMYVVDLVRLANGSTGTGNGTSCGKSDFVALGSTVDAGLAIHELGHSFTLTHIDSVSPHYLMQPILCIAPAIRDSISRKGNSSERICTGRPWI